MRKLLLFLSLFLSTFVFGGPLKLPKGMVLDRGRHWSKDGLIGLWLGNEGIGDKLYDLSGNDYDLSKGGSPIWIAGDSGPAIDFLGGANNTYEIPKAGTLLDAPMGQLTLACRFKINTASVASSQMLMAIDFDGGGYQYYIRYQGGNDIRFRVEATGATQVTSSSDLVQPNIWYTVIGVYDGTNLNIYLDGQHLAGPGALTGPITSNGNPDFQLGGDGTLDLDGQISWAMIYDRALSASEIRQLYINPFIMFDQDVSQIRPIAVAAAPPAGGGQVIMIQMSAIPLVMIIGCVLMFSKGKKAA